MRRGKTWTLALATALLGCASDGDAPDDNPTPTPARSTRSSERPRPSRASDADKTPAAEPQPDLGSIVIRGPRPAATPAPTPEKPPAEIAAARPAAPEDTAPPRPRDPATPTQHVATAHRDNPNVPPPELAEPAPAPKPSAPAEPATPAPVATPAPAHVENPNVPAPDAPEPAPSPSPTKHLTSLTKAPSPSPKPVPRPASPQTPETTELVAPPTAVPPSPRDLARGRIDHALELESHGNFEAAIAELDSVIAEQADFQPAYRERGLALRIVGRNDLAAQDFEHATEIDKTDEVAWRAASELQEQQGNYKAAATCGERSFELSHGAADGRRRLARLWYLAGDHERARVHVDALLASDATDSEALSIRGRIRRSDGSITAGDRDLDEAIRVHPELAEPYYQRGMAHVSEGRGRARPDLEKFLELMRPGDPRQGDVKRIVGQLTSAAAPAPPVAPSPEGPQQPQRKDE